MLPGRKRTRPVELLRPLDVGLILITSGINDARSILSGRSFYDQKLSVELSCLEPDAGV